MTNKKTGRPPISKTERTVRLSATIKESQAEFLTEYGRGNASQGLRWLVDEKRLEKPDEVSGQ